MTTSTLYRLAGLAGVIGAVLTLLAAARRAQIVPENALTHALAPPASALLLFTLTALYLVQRDQVGRLGLLGFVLNQLGLAGLFAIEFLTHAVLQFQSEAAREAIVSGPGRGYFLVVACTFLIGVVVFAAASVRGRVLPVGAVVLYAVGLVPAALRTSVPEAVYLGGLTLGAIGVGWMSLFLVRASASTLTSSTPALASSRVTTSPGYSSDG